MYWIAGDVTFGDGCVLVDGAAVAGGDPVFGGVVAGAGAAPLRAIQAATISAVIETIL